MLKKSNDKQLADEKIDSKYFLFYQIWKELTDKRTIDSYQYRIMNSISILHELNKVILLKLQGFTTGNHNIKDCRLEALKIIRSDSIIEKHHYATWTSLTKHLGKNAESSSDLKALSYQIRYANDTISSNYLLLLFEEVEEAIENADNQRISKLTKAIVSYCSFLEWSDQALYRLIDVLKNSTENPDAWNQFKNKLLPVVHNEYTIFIPIEFMPYAPSGIKENVFSQTIIEEIQGFGIQVKSYDQIITLNECFKNMNMKKQNYATITIWMSDPYSACFGAIKEYSNALNMLGFFNYIKPWSNKQLICWIVEAPNKKTIRVCPEDLLSSIEFKMNEEIAFNAAQKLLVDENSTLGLKLSACFAYSNMGKGASSLEDKFMNSWVALESLCRSDSYDNIIGNIIETVPAALCTRYMHRLFYNFLEDCNRCAIDMSFSGGKAVLTNPASRDDRVKNLIVLLNNSIIANEFEEKCSANSLLLFRFKEISQYATNQNAMVNKIKEHHSTVQQQLSRLYRTRNEIAHMGSISTDSLSFQIKHLKNYLTTFVLEVVTMSEQKNETQAEVLFEIIKDNYDSFSRISSMKKLPSFSQELPCLFDSGIIDFI